MSDVWESAGLVTEVWESNTTPGVEWRVIIRDGDIVATVSLADLTDVDVTSDPPAQDDVLAWDDVEEKWTPATLEALGGGGAVGRVNYQGTFDCSTNPNYPSAAKGDSYRVSVAGRIGGASGVTVAVGDSFECLSDSTSGDQAAVGVNWRVFRGPSHEHSTADLSDMSAFGRTLVDDANAAAARATLEVNGPASLTFGHDQLPTGRWTSNSLTMASSAQNYTPNNLWFCPYIAPVDMTVDRIAVEVTTGGTASATGRVGIYNVSGGVPTSLIVDAGTFAVHSLGVKEITLGSTVSLVRGRVYALAFFHGSAVNVGMRIFSFTSGTPQLSEATVGGNNTSPRRTWSRMSFTYGSLPSPAGTVTTETVSPVSFYLRGA